MIQSLFTVFVCEQPYHNFGTITVAAIKLQWYTYAHNPKQVCLKWMKKDNNIIYFKNTSKTFFLKKSVATSFFLPP